MPKKVLLVGHCGADATYLKLAVRSADPEAAVAAAEDEQSLREALENDDVSLVLFNRVLSYGFRDDSGVEVIRELKPEYPGLRMILVSNYPEAQEAAIQAGAMPGFGKRDLGSRRVVDLLKQALLSAEMEASEAAELN